MDGSVTGNQSGGGEPRPGDGLGLRVDPQRRLDRPSVVEARPRWASRRTGPSARGCAGHDRRRDGDRPAESRRPARRSPSARCRPVIGLPPVNSKERFLMPLGHDTPSAAQRRKEGVHGRSRPVSRILCARLAASRRPSLSALSRRGAVRRRRAAYPGARTGRPRTLPAWPCSGWGLPSRPDRPSRW